MPQRDQPRVDDDQGVFRRGTIKFATFCLALVYLALTGSFAAAIVC